MKTFSALLLLTLAFVACAPTEPALPEQLQMEEELGFARETFSDPLVGLSFEYPSDWTFERTEDAGAITLSLSANEPRDGYSCEEPTTFVSIRSVETDQSFEEYAMDPTRYDEGGSLGAWSGLEETTFLGQPAYSVGAFGWESYCPATGYLVELPNGRVLEFAVMQNTDQFGYSDFFDSIELTQ